MMTQFIWNTEVANVKSLTHSMFTMTLNTYGDSVPEEDDRALDTLSEPPALVVQLTHVLQMPARQANWGYRARSTLASIPAARNSLASSSFQAPPASIGV